MLTPGQTRWSIPLPQLQANARLLSALARAFLVAEPELESIVASAGHTLGRRWRWITPVARRFLERFGNSARPRLREVEKFIQADASFQRAVAARGAALQVAAWPSDEPRMRPAPAAKSWSIPAILTESELAAWLRVRENELAWFANLRSAGPGRAEAKLQHYRYRALAKADGSLRLIEGPKPRLKTMQQKILAQILDAIPVHPAVHGFVKGRSIKTFAAPHAGKQVVLRMDLKDFFPTLGRAQIQAFFRTAGYPERVADLLGGLCTNTVPLAGWQEFGADRGRFDAPFAVFEARQLYGRPHLPQGAPTSPALANLCMYRADSRLSGLARAAGADYTRYADDLAFSGGEQFARAADRFAAHVAAILREEGFRVNHRKTRVMRRGVRQHLAGVVTNEHVNVLRADFDRLKATLTNCANHGPHTQNRKGLPDFRAHLAGRVAFVGLINPQKGAKLRKIFERIQWDSMEQQ
jgi:RNA-directed DNA polymerase